MTLRDDVRDYFEREARQSPTPPGLLANATSWAVARQARPASLRWAAVVASVLAIAIVIGLVAIGAFKQSKGVVPVAPPVHVTPGMHRFVFDVSFANSADGWALLGNVRPGSTQFYVEATHDGGATWLTPVAAGRPYLNSALAAPLRHIHFVDRDDGFVYGGRFAFATHDGGRTWVDAGLPADVVAITGQEGVAWGVTLSSGCLNTCSYAAYVSADGGKSWVRTAPLPIVPRGATSFGITGLLVTADSSGDLALTSDSGNTWTRITGPCAASTAISGAATADGREIWEICSPYLSPDSPSLPIAPFGDVFVSEDSGATWQSRGHAGGGVAVEIVLSPIAGTALVATDTNQMQISHDAGQTWRTCTTDPSHPVIRALSYSADGSVAAAVDSAYVVWISRDGGNTWQKTANQP